MKNYRKFIVATLGAVAVAISEGLVPAEWSGWLTVAVAFCTAIGVYTVENVEDEGFDELD